MKLRFGIVFASIIALCAPAAAQWQTPNHSVPTGRGGGGTGFNYVAPGTAGLPLVSNGATADPSFRALPLPAQVYNPVTAPPYNAKCDGVTDDSAAIQAAITAAPLGSRIDIPGLCAFAAPLDFRGKSYVTVTGNSRSGTQDQNSALVYTGGAATRAIDLRDTVAIGFYGVNMLWTSASASGIFLDYGSQTPGTGVSFYGSVQQVTFEPRVSGSATTVTCLNFSEAIEWTVAFNSFNRCQYGIQGSNLLGQSTVGLILHNQFYSIGTLPIASCGESWSVVSNTFEQLANGKAAAMSNTSSLPCQGLAVIGNWFGDATVSGGTWLNISVNGFTFSGNRMSSPSAVGNGALGLASSTGFNITGNNFENFPQAVSNFGGTVDGGIVCGNAFRNVTAATSGVGANVLSTGCNASY